MKVRELVQKFDELYARFEELKKERDGLQKALEDLGRRLEEEAKSRARAEENALVLSGRLIDAENKAAEREAALAESAKVEKDLRGQNKILEKHKAGLQEKCIELEKSRKSLLGSGADGSIRA